MTATIAILHPGEMGAAVASLLRAGGHRVITTLAGRSAQTLDRCNQAGIEILPTLSDVVQQSNLVLSLVLPAAAESVVDDYCQHAHLAPVDAIYVDLNSISPELSKTLAGKIEQTGRAYVDAAINGLAKNLITGGTIFLSGPRAQVVANAFVNHTRVKVLSGQIGDASAMKMLLAGLSKGLCGLFTELALVARHHNMLDAMIQTTADIYPGMMQVVDRMLPTYATHAARRATEMAELQSTARAAGIEPLVLTALRQLHEHLDDVNYSNPAPNTVAFINQLADQGLLQPVAFEPVNTQ